MNKIIATPFVLEEVFWSGLGSPGDRVFEVRDQFSDEAQDKINRGDKIDA